MNDQTYITPDSQNPQDKILTPRQEARLDALIRRYPSITSDSPTMLTVYDTSTVMMRIDLPDGVYWIFRLWQFKTWECANRKLYAAMDYIASKQGGAQ